MNYSERKALSYAQHTSTVFVKQHSCCDGVQLQDLEGKNKKTGSLCTLIAITQIHNKLTQETGKIKPVTHSVKYMRS